MADTFRQTYKQLSSEQIELIRAMKEKASELETLITGIEGPVGRYISLAMTNLEQSIMWATKAVS